MQEIPGTLPAIIDKREFQGAMPAKISQSGGDGFGTFPIEEIIDYLKKFPQKPLP